MITYGDDHDDDGDDDYDDNYDTSIKSNGKAIAQIKFRVQPPVTKLW